MKQWIDLICGLLGTAIFINGLILMIGLDFKQMSPAENMMFNLFLGGALMNQFLISQKQDKQ